MGSLYLQLTHYLLYYILKISHFILSVNFDSYILYESRLDWGGVLLVIELVCPNIVWCALMLFAVS